MLDERENKQVALNPFVCFKTTSVYYYNAGLLVQVILGLVVSTWDGAY